MRKLLLAFGAMTMVATTAVVPVTPVQAKKHYKYREWRGKDGRTYCRRSNGTTGLVIGGVAGGLVGRAVDSHGIVGTLVGAGAGALAGREIDRNNSKRRCR